MADGDIVRQYQVIQRARSWGVWWADLERQNGELVWIDGGHISNHRTVESAAARADSLAATSDARRYRKDTPS